MSNKNVMIYIRPFGGGSLSGYALPCWSVSALLNIMPDIKKNIDTYIPYIVKDGSIYYCFYADECQDGLIELKSCCDQSILDACYNMVIWLLENNYIKK